MKFIDQNIKEKFFSGVTKLSDAFSKKNDEYEIQKNILDGLLVDMDNKSVFFIMNKKKQFLYWSKSKDRYNLTSKIEKADRFTSLSKAKRAISNSKYKNLTIKILKLVDVDT